ncbi:MAG: hypothetical protein FH756_14430 [Firmicutes bacterium]|nr:hypothetical protein [Bacillota bacterium]
MSNKTDKLSYATTFPGLPLSFEANHGQTDPQVKFLARGRGYTLYLTRDEAVLMLQQSEEKPKLQKQVKTLVLRMNLASANRHPQVAEQEELPGKSNYFIGNDPARWRTNIPTYARIKYRDVYPGVDMVYYGSQGQLEWDFVVAPGADPMAITLDFQGTELLEVDEKGNLLLQASGKEMYLQKPFVYQDVDGARREISSGYMVKDHNRVGFQLDEYDTATPLVIDPVLVYSTYLGGSAGDFGDSIAVDSSGSAYVTGDTSSLNFSTQNPLQPDFGGGIRDTFITKIDPSGSALLYSTYLGGSGNESGFGIALDLFDNAYVTGNTDSLDFPTSNPLQPIIGGSFDAFVAKIFSFLPV